MKNFLLMVVVLSLLSFTACSQKNPPENVKKEFNQKYVGAKSVSWSSEKKNEWEAEFKLNGKEMSACFDNSGKWLETEAEVNVKDLPAAVANTLKNEFAGFKTDEISTVENPEMKGYEFALKNKESKLTVVIGADGKVLEKESGEGEKKETVNENDEKDEKAEKSATKTGEEKEVDAPMSIVKAFNQKFPGAKSVEWGSESKNEWEAEFTVDGKKMSASFDSSAVWMVTETVISEKELPSAVVATLNKDFAGFKKSLIEIYEDSKIKGFELELKKGEASMEVILDNTGKVIKKSELKEEDEKEE